MNAVLPGPVETEGTQSMADWDQFKTMLVPRTPLGRVGQPRDIATVVSFLASDDAGWITGQIIPAARRTETLTLRFAAGRHHALDTHVRY